MTKNGKTIYFFEWIPCSYGMTRLGILNGGYGRRIWRAATKRLNKECTVAGWHSSFSDWRV